MPFSLTYLDAALIALAFISGLLAMYRGFTRELLSIASWGGAALISVYAAIYSKETAQDVANQMNLPNQSYIPQIAIGAIVFLIALIIIHLITARISDAILDSRVGMIDRIFGFAFGAARGALIVVVVFLLADGILFGSYYLHSKEGSSNVELPANVPEFIDKAQSKDLIVSTGKMLHGFMVGLYEQWEPLIRGGKTEGEQQG